MSLCRNKFHLRLTWHWIIYIIYIYIYIYISSSSSCCAISMDIPDPLSPPQPIVHCLWQVFRVTCRIVTELLYVYSSGLSCLCSSMWRSPQEYITYELIPTSPTVSCMSDSSNLIVFVKGGRIPYSCCFVRCCLHDLFNIACCILV